MATYQVVIQGRVQGVGYRMFVREMAWTRGWQGEVWNASNGDVEATIVTEDSPEEIEAALRRGPGSVNQASIQIWESTSEYESFKIVRGGFKR